MEENSDEILRKIKERVKSIGYDLFCKGRKSRGQEEVLNLTAQSKEADNLHFTVAKGASYLRLTFPEKDSVNCVHKKFRGLSEMLDFIEACLLNR